MNRRFVNLVVANYSSRMYSLHRLDASKHLFYPSTAEAEEAIASKVDNNGGGSGSKDNSLMIGKLSELPEPVMRFESSPTTDPRWWRPGREDTFMLLRSLRSGEACRILHINMAGHATLYDADARSVVSVPDLGVPKGFRPIPFAVPGAGEDEEGSLYLMRSVPMPTMPRSFEALRFGSSHSRGRLLMDLYPKNSFKWDPLPPPPLHDGCFGASAVVNGGRTICVSSVREGDGTFCFDMASHEWRRAGKWKLPFEGRAEHVSEVDTWLGFSPDHPHHLCAADLSAITGDGGAIQAPALQHVWEDFNLLPTEESSVVLNEDFLEIIRRKALEWWADQLHLVSLGSGRLCVAKAFEAEEVESLSCSFDDHRTPKGRLTVLTGVEVVRDGGEGGGLRMVKHKSKRFVFPGNSIKWVL